MEDNLELPKGFTLINEESPPDLKGLPEGYEVVGSGRAGDMTSTLGGRSSFMPARASEESRGVVEGVLEESPRFIGATAGGIAGATKGAALGAYGGLPGVAMGTVLGGAVGSLAGGASGETLSNIYKYFTGKEGAPETTKEIFYAAVEAGNEDAVWSLAGDVAFKSLGSAFRALKPKAVEGIERLNVKLEEAGGRFPLAAQTDNWIVHQLDSITRSAFTGKKAFAELDNINEESIKLMQNRLSEYVAKNASKVLSDKEVGELFLSTIRDGREAHRASVSSMYEQFDSLVPSATTTKRISRKVNDPALIGTGAGQRTVMEEVEVEDLPVKLLNVKSGVVDLANSLKKIKNIGEDPKAVKLLEDFEGLDDSLSFASAQTLRSNLLDLQRNLENQVGKSKVTSKITGIVDDMTKAMDAAAARQGGDVFSKYQKIKAYARKGYETFDNKFLADLIVADKKNPERVAEYIFKAGNETEIRQVKKALRAASSQSKELSYDKTWQQMQSYYLESLFNKTSKLVDTPVAPASVTMLGNEFAEVSGEKLLNVFLDKKQSRTMNAVFGKEVVNELKDLALITQRLQKANKGQFGVLATLLQAGVIGAAFSGGVGPATLAVLATPKGLSKVLTSPNAAKYLKTALTHPPSTKLGQEARNELGRITVNAIRLLEEGASPEEKNNTQQSTMGGM